MDLTNDHTKHIARLARIRLDAADVEEFTQELNGILHWIEQLSAVDTEGVAQMTSVADMRLPMREDTVTDGGRQEALLNNAPAAEYGCFVVPKVIE